MKTIGILGCGWLGEALAKTLVNENHTVKGTTTSQNKISALRAKNIIPYVIDLSNDEIPELESFLQDLDLLIIAIPPFRDEPIPTYAENFKKLSGFLNPDLPVFMMSSLSVYAPQKTIITEDSNHFSEDTTAKQIRAAEKVLQSLSKQVTILRLGGLFGTDRHPVAYIAKLPFLNNPDLSINMIHQADIVRFTLFLIEKEPRDAIYNFVSPAYLNRRFYYTKMSEALALKLPPEGVNDWHLEKKVDGTKIVNQSGLPYLF